MLIPVSRAIVFDLCDKYIEEEKLSNKNLYTFGNFCISMFVGVGQIASYSFVSFVKDPYLWAVLVLFFFTFPSIFFVSEKKYVNIKKRGGGVKYSADNCSADQTHLSSSSSYSSPSSSSPDIALSSPSPSPSSLKENQMEKEKEKEQKQSQGPIRLLFTVCKQIFTRKDNIPIFRACMCYLLCWCAMFSFLPLGTSFMAEVVYHAHPSSSSPSSVTEEQSPEAIANTKLYAAGIRMGGIALLIHSLFIFLSSILFSSLLNNNRIGYKKLFIFIQGLGAACFIALFMISFNYTHVSTPPVWSLILVIVLNTLCSLSVPLFFAIPFILINEHLAAHPPHVVLDADTSSVVTLSGLYSGILNCFCVVGESVSLGISSVITYFVNRYGISLYALDGGGSNRYYLNRHAYQWVVLMCGIISVFAALYILVLQRRQKPSTDSSVTNVEEGENARGVGGSGGMGGGRRIERDGDGGIPVEKKKKNTKPDEELEVRQSLLDKEGEGEQEGGEDGGLGVF